MNANGLFNLTADRDPISIRSIRLECSEVIPKSVVEDSFISAENGARLFNAFPIR